MRNLGRLDKALQLLNAGAPRQDIVKAIDRSSVSTNLLPTDSRSRELIEREMMHKRLSEERYEGVADPWAGAYTADLPIEDGLEMMAERAVQERLGIPSMNPRNKVTLDTPVKDLTPSEQRAQRMTQEIINDKLKQLGLGALATGGTAALINAQQGDSNPLETVVDTAGGLVGTGLAVGAGGLAGYHLSNAPSPEMALAMSQDRKRGSGNGYQRDAAFERDYGRKYDRKVKQRGVRGGLRGAAIGAGGVALLQLMGAMQDEG